MSISTTTASTDLQQAIQAAILQDPRAAQLTPVQLSAMVHALSAQAQIHGVTAQQVISSIQYATNTAAQGMQQGQEDICARNTNFLCFIDPQSAIIASVGLCLLVLAILVAALRLHRA